MSNKRRLEGKVCLITGSTGIAAATAELACQQGARLFITSRTAEHGLALAEKLRSDQGACEFLQADLTSPQSVVAVTQACLARFGRIDVLFNVAGISGRKFGDGPIHDCSEEGWDITMETNVKSMFLMCRAVVNQLLRQNIGENGLRGSILNMASVLGFSPSPRYFATHAYAASKGAIIALSKSMAAYYAPMKIRVNAIAPALVQTPMSRRAQENLAVLAFMKTKQPLTEQLLSADAIANSALFFMSDEAAAVTGEVFSVDAGWCVSEGQY